MCLSASGNRPFAFCLRPFCLFHFAFLSLLRLRRPGHDLARERARAVAKGPSPGHDGPRIWINLLAGATFTELESILILACARPTPHLVLLRLAKVPRSLPQRCPRKTLPEARSASRYVAAPRRPRPAPARSRLEGRPPGRSCPNWASAAVRYWFAFWPSARPRTRCRQPDRRPSPSPVLSARKPSVACWISQEADRDRRVDVGFAPRGQVNQVPGRTRSEAPCGPLTIRGLFIAKSPFLRGGKCKDPPPGHLGPGGGPQNGIAPESMYHADDTQLGRRSQGEYIVLNFLRSAHVNHSPHPFGPSCVLTAPILTTSHDLSPPWGGTRERKRDRPIAPPN